ncbi:ipa protein [Colletotrichum chrysophilum]|uniref:Ipa protein n=1 Tax=Colletotrichum chrysophilum TaxID=1836956 RepID=A0AAD9E6Y1_9PEZI|nr:ipa protein [Colletotrichum chrysophilum]
MEAVDPGFVQELHADLARKYRTHAAKLETAWRSFDKSQRTRCLKAGAANGDILRHPLDTRLGNVYKFIPEWNIRDLTEPDSDLLLDRLKHRATLSLEEQYFRGLDGSDGDHDHILTMMRTKRLRHVASFENCFTTFMDSRTSRYGRSFRLLRDIDECLSDLEPAFRAGVCVPQSVGELILQRQLYMLQCLNIVVEDVLEIDSRTRNQSQRPERNTPGTGLVPDEKGRSLPVHTGKHISGAVSEAVHGEVQAAAIWAYITRLVEALEASDRDKTYRALILQELSNVCQLEYERAQALFRRHVATGAGPKRFKRISNTYDNAGNARLAMKGKPEDLTRSDPLFSYLLRLCQPSTAPSNATDWMKRLGDLYTAHPTKKGRAFVKRSRELEAELTALKTEIDLRDYAVPIDNLLEPGMAEGALAALEEFVVANAGTKIGFLYQDLITECFADLESRYEQMKIDKAKNTLPAACIDLAVAEPKEAMISRRKEKLKTRPSQASTYELSPRHSVTVEQPRLSASSETIQIATWTSFETAMAELGFSVYPRYGSVYTFRPPMQFKVERPLTIHRPHQSQIEGYRLLILARRLNRTYGWSEKTFKLQ